MQCRRKRHVATPITFSHMAMASVVLDRSMHSRVSRRGTGPWCFFCEQRDISCFDRVHTISHVELIMIFSIHMLYLIQSAGNYALSREKEVRSKLQTLPIEWNTFL